MKLKKIASLMLAGVMAVSMLAGCSTTSNEVPQDPTTPPTTTPVSGKSAVFEAQLSDLADVKITMEDSADLQAALDAAVEAYGAEDTTPEEPSDEPAEEQPSEEQPSEEQPAA